MDRIKKIQTFCFIVGTLGLVLVALGGFVRATGAGLACPDWPLCFGRVVPELKWGVAQEYFHRVLGGGVGACILLLSLFSFFRRKEYRRMWNLSLFLLLLVAIQGIIGGLTVIWRLNPVIVTVHLALGTIFVQLILLVAFERVSRDTSEVIPFEFSRADRFFRTFLVFLTGLVFLQIIVGGFVGSSGAALACRDFLFCNGALVPDHASSQQLTQIIHRGLGLLILLFVVVACVVPSGLTALAQQHRSYLFRILLLIALQILLGMSNVYAGIPVSITISHLVVSQLILLSLVLLVKRLFPGLRIFASVYG